jgi:hypothetical protein
VTIAEQVKAVRARATIRRWEYRQRNLAHGAWTRFRFALAHARLAYAIDDATAAALLAEGFTGDDRGHGLEPPRTLVWIAARRADELVGARSIALTLGPELLAARCLALVAFDDPPAASPSPGRSSRRRS